MTQRLKPDELSTNLTTRVPNSVAAQVHRWAEMRGEKVPVVLRRLIRAAVLAEEYATERNETPAEFLEHLVTEHGELCCVPYDPNAEPVRLRDLFPAFQASQGGGMTLTASGGLAVPTFGNDNGKPAGAADATNTGRGKEKV